MRGVYTIRTITNTYKEQILKKTGFRSFLAHFFEAAKVNAFLFPAK